MPARTGVQAEHRLAQSSDGQGRRKRRQGSRQHEELTPELHEGKTGECCGTPRFVSAVTAKKHRVPEHALSSCDDGQSAKRATARRSSRPRTTAVNEQG